MFIIVWVIMMMGFSICYIILLLDLSVILLYILFYVLCAYQMFYSKFLVLSIEDMDLSMDGWSFLKFLSLSFFWSVCFSTVECTLVILYYSVVGNLIL